jgi:hypothetical protein
LIFLPQSHQGTKLHQDKIIKDIFFMNLGVFVSWWQIHLSPYGISLKN